MTTLPEIEVAIKQCRKHTNKSNLYDYGFNHIINKKEAIDHLPLNCS